MWKKIALTACAAALLVGCLAGCDGSDQITTNADGKKVVSIMTAAYQSESASDDASKNPVMAAIEDKLGVDLKIRWTASSNYGEKVTAAMGAETYPNIMKVGDRSAAIVQNCRGGTFWDVTDLVTDASKYPNLAKANKQVLHNMSVDGRIYGVYLSRDLGRNGVTIRKDWLENIGYDHYPRTLAEFRDVLEKFTYNDPDGNGQDDTYGMVMTSFTGPIDNMLVWCGAPNGWGLKKDAPVGEKLQPAYFFDEYINGLNFIKDLYDNKLINGNWATMDSAKWNEPVLNGEAGVIIDVADRARRVQTNIKDRDPKAVIGVFGSVATDDNSQRRVLPTTGYNGFFVFPHASVKNEEELDTCLKILNDLEDPEISDLCNNGLEGVNYDVVNGYYQKKKTAEGKDDTSNDKYFADLNQMLTMVSNNESKVIKEQTVIAQEVEDVLDDNANYAVANPAAPYISKTASLKGTALDDIITEANTKYITGQIDLEQWKSERDRWKLQGGEKVIKEINEAYEADTSDYKDIGATAD